jgi:hypothetical protein
LLLCPWKPSDESLGYSLSPCRADEARATPITRRRRSSPTPTATARKDKESFLEKKGWLTEILFPN